MINGLGLQFTEAKEIQHIGNQTTFVHHTGIHGCLGGGDVFLDGQQGLGELRFIAVDPIDPFVDRLQILIQSFGENKKTKNNQCRT